MSLGKQAKALSKGSVSRVDPAIASALLAHKCLEISKLREGVFTQPRPKPDMAGLLTRSSRRHGP